MGDIGYCVVFNSNNSISRRHKEGDGEKMTPKQKGFILGGIIGTSLFIVYAYMYVTL